MSAVGKIGRSPRARVAGAVLVARRNAVYAGVAGAAGEAGTAAADTTISAVGDATEGQWDKGVADAGGDLDRRFGHVGLPGRRAQRRVDSRESGRRRREGSALGALRLPPGEFEVAPQGSSDSLHLLQVRDLQLHLRVPPEHGRQCRRGRRGPGDPGRTPTPTPRPTPDRDADDDADLRRRTPAAPVDDHTTTPRADRRRPTRSGPRSSGIKLKAQQARRAGHLQALGGRDGHAAGPEARRRRRCSARSRCRRAPARAPSCSAARSSAGVATPSP